jgi:hypothetical protein
MEISVGAIITTYEGALAVGDRIVITGTATVVQSTTTNSILVDDPEGAPATRESATLVLDLDTLTAVRAA